MVGTHCQAASQRCQSTIIPQARRAASLSSIRRAEGVGAKLVNGLMMRMDVEEDGPITINYNLYTDGSKVGFSLPFMYKHCLLMHE